MNRSRPAPSYVAALHNGRLDAAVRQAWQRMGCCDLCPRVCGVDRCADGKGVCRTGKRAVVASAGPHFGEELPLVGAGGSGTIFFSGCNLLCRFCQNWQTSRCLEGEPVSVPALARMMLRLQAQGCENVNFVSPTHVAAPLLSAIRLAARQGLEIPLVYNTGGYDRVDALRLFDGVVDVFMPDLKMARPESCEALLHAQDYWPVATAAVREMHRQVGDLRLDARGRAFRGLLVRHLVMPAGVADTQEVVRFLAEEVSTDTYLNVMAQYRPVGDAHRLEEIDRRPTREEVAQAVSLAKARGLHRLA